MEKQNSGLDSSGHRDSRQGIPALACDNVGRAFGFRSSYPSDSLLILFGTVTGNAEMIAYRVEEAARRDGFATRVEDMARCKAEGLTRERSVLIVVSTYGNGEPPPDAIRFWEDIVRDQSLDLRGLKFSVLALGNSTYDHFCKCGKDFDEALERLGATRLFPRVDSDMDFTAPVDLWIDGVLGALTQEYLASAA